MAAWVNIIIHPNDCPVWVFLGCSPFFVINDDVIDIFIGHLWTQFFPSLNELLCTGIEWLVQGVYRMVSLLTGITHLPSRKAVWCSGSSSSGPEVLASQQRSGGWGGEGRNGAKIAGVCRWKGKAYCRAAGVGAKEDECLRDMWKWLRGAWRWIGWGCEHNELEGVKAYLFHTLSAPGNIRLTSQRLRKVH